MKRIVALCALALCVLAAPSAKANQRIFGWCTQGGVVPTVSGLPLQNPAGTASQKIQANYPGCTVTVSTTGGGTPTIYSDNSGTVKGNPFTADTTTGFWYFYVANGHVDVQLSGAGIPSTFTLGDIIAFDNTGSLSLSGTLTVGGLITASGGITSVGPNILNGTTTVTGNLTATAGQNQINAGKINGSCVVDGVLYSTIAAAQAACPTGEVIVPAGTYAVSSTITIAAGQQLRFVGNPTLNFTLGGSDPAIATSTNTVPHNFLSGAAVINMQGTGGTVFKICGGDGFTFGPEDGILYVENAAGNIIDLGPCTNTESMMNFVVRGIHATAATLAPVPGDFVQVITNNYTGTQSAAPFILGGRLERLSNDLNDANTLGITGYAVRVNVNATGPNVNVQGLVIDNCLLQTGNANAKPPIHIQSTLLTGANNAINFAIRNSYLSSQTGGQPSIVDVDNATTAGAVWGVTLDNVMATWSAVSTPFSATLLGGTAVVPSFIFRGSAIPYENRITHNAVSFIEGTTPNALAGAGFDGCYGDSTAHALKCSNNNDTFSRVMRYSDPTLTLKKGSGGGNITSASTTYVVADSTNLCYTITIPTGWKLGISASGNLGTSTAIVFASAALADNANCITQNSGILVETQVSGQAIGATEPFALNWVITGDGNQHSVGLQFKTSNASDSALLLNSSSTLLPTMVFMLMPSN